MDEHGAQTADTVIEGVRASTTPATDPGAASATDATSRDDALRLEEVERWRGMIRLGRGIGLAMILPLPLLGGAWIPKLVFAGAIVACVAWGYVLERMMRDPSQYTERRVLALSLGIVVAAYAGIFYWGIFSAAPTFIVLGIYFLARGESRASAAIIYGTNAALLAVLVTLVLTGVLPDVGIFHRPDVPMQELLVEQGLIQVAYLTAFWMALASRRATLESIDNIQRAMRLASRREALLLEARNDLDRALRIGGPGQYTDQTFGSYEVGNLIGRGAMGEVYEAVHQQDGEPAAIKLLRAEVLRDPRQVARFMREARAASALQSPNVVRVLEASDPLEPVPYLVMERLHGEDLAAILRQRPVLPGAEVIEIVRQVGRVIDAAREQGIVHRDLKPHNLFLARQPDGREIWKVLDFGVSMLGDSSGTLTHGHVVGTPAYMAPEQARGDAVDHRADQYALAAIAYRCLTGHPPFSGKDVAALLYRVVHTAPKRPSELAELPRQVDAVLMTGMAKHPGARYDSAETFADALELALGRRLEAAG